MEIVIKIQINVLKQINKCDWVKSALKNSHRIKKD